MTREQQVAAGCNIKLMEKGTCTGTTEVRVKLVPPMEKGTCKGTTEVRVKLVPPMEKGTGSTGY